MTDQERNQILKMIENGKITPEEGLQLIQTLEQTPAEEEMQVSAAPAGEGSGSAAEPSNFETDERVNRFKTTARRLWQIPLWTGVGVTVLSALGMFWIMQGPGMNFWFYFLLLPLFLGVALTVIAVGSRRARWLFVDVQQKPGKSPERVLLGFPLPLKLTAWFLRTFGRFIPSLERTNVDEMIQIIGAGFAGDSPLIVNVDEGHDGERVQIFIG